MFVSDYLHKFLTFSLHVLAKRVIIPTYLRTSISRKRQEQTLPLPRTFLKEHSISFLMVCRLIDFALVVLQLLMFKVCGIIGISKIQFFNFSGNERVKLYLSHRKNCLNSCFLPSIILIWGLVSTLSSIVPLHWGTWWQVPLLFEKREIC